VVSITQISPPKPCMHISSHRYVLHGPPISSRFVTRIIFGEDYISVSSSLCCFLHSPANPSVLGPNILLSTLFSNTFNPLLSLNVSNQVSHPYKTTCKMIVLYILILIYLDRKIGRQKILHRMIENFPWFQSALNFYLSRIFIH
jgi:hypothetical protein